MKKLIFFLVENWSEISIFAIGLIIRFFEKRNIKNKFTELLNEIYPELKTDKQRRGWWNLVNSLKGLKK